MVNEKILTSNTYNTQTSGSNSWTCFCHLTRYLYIFYSCYFYFIVTSVLFVTTYFSLLIFNMSVRWVYSSRLDDLFLFALLNSEWLYWLAVGLCIFSFILFLFVVCDFVCSSLLMFSALGD